jgi:uncharacterized membrane protein YfcA
MTDLILVVIIFSIIQSVFGVGLLLFGTPTLLLIGYSYSEVLWILLPCSIVISLIQTIDGYNLIRAKKKVVYYTIPVMTLSLVLVVSYDNVLDISKIVGSFLLLIGMVKFSSKLQSFLRTLVETQLTSYYVLIGVVHGISNMGGGPLSILMSTIYDSKMKIRANIAFIYLVLASFQLIILYFIDKNSLKYASASLILISLAIYLITNKYIANKINNEKYTISINILILLYGVLAFL